MANQIAKRHRYLKSLDAPLTIGFTAVADFSSFIGQEYLSGIMKASSDYGINFINMASAIRHSIFSDTRFIAEYFSKVNFMRAPLLDGLITWASSLCEFLPEEKILQTFSSLSPLPMVDIGYLDIPGVPSIRIDNEYSIYMIVEHLVKVHGFSRIAFIGSNHSCPHLERLKKFNEAMQAFNLPVEDSSIFMASSLDPRDVEQQVDAFLSLHKNAVIRQDSQAVQAIVTSSDIIALTVIETLEKNSISVPDMIAVTGFNNQFAGITSPSPVTTIDLAYFRRGYEAVELLIDRIMSKSAPSQTTPGSEQELAVHTVKTSLIIRQSCGCFEDTITDAEYRNASASPFADDDSDSSSEKIYSYLQEKVSGLFMHDSLQNQKELIDALLDDMYSNNTPPPYISMVPNLYKKEFPFSSGNRTAA